MRVKKSVPVAILLTSPVFIVILMALSIVYGTKNIELSAVQDAIFHFDSGNVDHQIIMHSRLPRAIGALLIGAFLAMSGALMQGMTRNFLASPSIMGVSDGSAFVITVCMIFMPNTSSLQMIMYSLIGSAIGVGIVLGFASLLPNGMTPVRLAIIGTVIGTVLSSMSQALSTYFQISQNLSFWYNSRLHQIDPDLITLAIPFAIVGILLALFLSKSITILSLGEEIAVNLGQRTALIKGLTMLTVVILTGISVALVGKIGFVGLIVPHIARFLVGIDYRWIVPCSAVIGGIFLVFCDILSRFMNYPFETPIGVVTSLFGIPFFLYLIVKKGGEKHGS
ncbi:FecCD family ABC transporter permease [Brevibacillus laterosporus]|uniref:FecCD family ABC transporter permease n=1 Tax=Brevibacillus laterosporus TaxID=1465 RepID=UPI00037EE67C|nr:iron ABC transporter permease [Brevibacillus laterosporus]ATO49654.1 ferrichrome ABC transporter permease [Brevibacillus laterosporus DSM 25]AYB40218.1 iron ABC transporter permease [Brevibacillus laterosporus]MBG9771651.1 ferrichrome ABC transporter permease [Brevibacillus laterosporus]MBG9798040.1 ferrichrome ABC transporter permease [Brevibacillus laterosporus]MBG9801063.1 ferrichrome ABC transporter permease [Brevibacillus laterosporus]